MTDHSDRGFTLIELAITILVMGIVLGFSIPAFTNLSASYQLRGAAEDVAGQLRLAREKAIATGVVQPMHLPATLTSGVYRTYHIHYPAGISTAWLLPNGIAFTSASVNTWYRMQTDGRCDNSGLIVLTDRRGNRDTVSVQLSGLVLTR